MLLAAMLSASFTTIIDASELVPKKVENATLHIILEYSATGEASLIVKKVKLNSYEPEEMARLLTHWYSKMLYLFQNNIMPEMYLKQEVNNALFEPKIKRKDNILKKAQIDDVIKLVKRIEKKKVISTIELYLQELPSNQRGVVSFLKGDPTEQQTVFSWSIILQYASENYNKKDLYFIHDMMGKTIKAYSAGADDDNLQNSISIPNNAYFKIKMNK